jgi:hypothetical protein
MIALSRFRNSAIVPLEGHLKTGGWRARAGGGSSARRRARAGVGLLHLGLQDNVAGLEVVHLVLQDTVLPDDSAVGLGELVILSVRLLELPLEFLLDLFEFLELLEQLGNVALAICG